MRALSIRQPYAELILRGMKRIEYRNGPTRIIGERFYIYAAGKPGPADEFARLGVEPGELSTGVIVGTAVISHCTQGERFSEWHLTGVERLDTPLKPTRHPQPVWFIPF